MKALVWRGTDQLALEDVPEPEREESIVVRVRFTGICGSDITIKSGKHPRAKAPLVLGHEFSGAIAYVPGRLGSLFSEGQRVVVNPLISCKTCRPCLSGNEHVCENLKLIGIERNPGAFTRLVSVPQAERIHLLPDSVSDREGALVEPLAVAVHAVDYARLERTERVVILGAGPIGLMIAQVVKASGVTEMRVVETEVERLRLAERLGFRTIHAGQEDVLPAVNEWTHGQGADVTFDAAGVPQTASQVIALTGIKGRIVMVAIHKKPAEVLFRDLAYRELTIQGTRIYAKGSFARAIALVAAGKVDVKPLITDVLPMGDALRAFAIAQNDKAACKVLVEQQ